MALMKQFICNVAATALNGLNVYHPIANRWEYMASLEMERQNHRGSLYAIGEQGSFTWITIEKYDEQINKCTEQ